MPGQNTGPATGYRTHDIAQSVMTLRGSDLLDWIKQSFRQENSNIHMAHKAFLATAEEGRKKKKKTCLVLHPHILYFTRKGKWSVCVRVYVFARETEILLKCFRHQYWQPRVFKATLSYLEIGPYNNVNSWEGASPDAVSCFLGGCFVRRCVFKNGRRGNMLIRVNHIL